MWTETYSTKAKVLILETDTDWIGILNYDISEGKSQNYKD